jgi:hypothetical protein
MLWNFHPYGQKTLWRSADSLSLLLKISMAFDITTTGYGIC